MADERTLASGIKYTEHLAVFDDIWRDRLAALDLTATLVYMVDIVPEGALIWLARQFGVMGNEGWAFTTTAEERRDLVKAAIELHRRKGTPYAVKAAIERATPISYADITILEGTTLTPYWTLDGTVHLSGAYFLGADAHWTEFAVIIDISGTGGPWTAALYSLLLALINEYKPVRSNLVNLGMGVFFEEELPAAPEDDLLLNAGMEPFEEEIIFTPYLDGTFDLDGNPQLDTDHLTLIIDIP